MKIRIIKKIEAVIVEDFDDDTQEEDSYPETFIAGQTLEGEMLDGWFELTVGGVFQIESDEYEVVE